MGLQARNPFENDELDDIKLEAPEGMKALRESIELDDDADFDPIDVNDVHYVAIAVTDLDESVARYRSLFGATVEDREAIADERVEVAVLLMGNSSRVALVAPTDDESWLVEFLDGQGSGISHIGLEVPDLAASMAALADRGWELVDEEPKAGVANSRTAYVHPPDEPGTLIQLIQLA